MATRNPKSTKASRDPDLAGAEAAMQRAAGRARRRAAETTGAVVVFKDGQIVKEKPGKHSSE